MRGSDRDRKRICVQTRRNSRVTKKKKRSDNKQEAKRRKGKCSYLRRTRFIDFNSSCIIWPSLFLSCFFNAFMSSLMASFRS
jgi:hypothetical protein